MDEIVKAALVKWPNVPNCYGWLGLDARGQWYMRDAQAQRCGPFQSGAPGSKGSLLKHDRLIAFIHRNYAADEAGQWYFQNGPQRVYVELQVTPLVWRVTQDTLEITAHTGQQAQVLHCVLDERGWVYLHTDLGFGLVHSQDVGLAAQALEQKIWPVQEAQSADFPFRFGYVLSPQSRQSSSLATEKTV